MNNAEQIALEFLSGKITLEQMHDQLRATDHAGDICEAESWLTAVAARAAHASRYLMHRGAAGCGDSGHDEALKDADRGNKAMRKVLGYSYP